MALATKLQSFAYLENGSFFARVETKSCSKLIILMQSQIAMCYMILSSLDEMKLWNVTKNFPFTKNLDIWILKNKTQRIEILDHEKYMTPMLLEFKVIQKWLEFKMTPKWIAY